jgi:stigma-specific protein Stig1
MWIWSQRFALATVAALAACSVKPVSFTPDTAGEVPVPDAAVAIDALVCNAGELVCGDGCVDPQQDERHCGDCATSCVNQQGCLAGRCVDATASCAVIHQLDPGAPDGPYVHAADGKMFYCDMAGGITYEALAYGRYNATYPGYELISAAALDTVVEQQAFIFLFNSQGGGAINLEVGFMSQNCCFTASAAGAARLAFGGSILQPATAGMNNTVCNATYGDAKYSWIRATASAFAPVPLPVDYFVSFPATDITGCGDANNPGLFFKRHL